MDYALAKELKDAGFPWKEGDWYTADGEWIPEKEREYAPTLEELIEACGQRFIALTVHTLYGFEARGVFLPMDADTVANGVTPTEAVARLWLALKKS